MSDSSSHPEDRGPEAATIATRVAAVFQDVLGLDQPPPLSTRIAEDLQPSSMDTMALVLTLEDEFDGTLPEQEMARMGTIGDVVTLIQAHIID